ncbi:MAG: hypothetical protein K6E59_00790 [Bacilli bacterium]|nr:hypothetical protein [Bacilli bacterium]
MWGIIAAIAIVTLLVAYVIGIFFYDYRRRKKGMPSIICDVCESEGHGRRLVRDYHRKYANKRK